MQTPLISFCLPVFNGEERIGRCLDSILQQDIPSDEREILVVDNASTDKTLSIVEERLKGIINVRIIRNDTNIGRIENWNRCLELATGRYIQIVMASDVLLQGTTKAKLRMFEVRADLVIVSSPGTGFPGHGEPYPAFPENPTREFYSSDETLRLFYERGPVTNSLNCVLFDGDVIRTLGLRFDPRYPFSADALFVTRVISKGSACFLSGPSCLFDSSNKNRYYFVGTSDPARYFSEHGAFVRLVTTYLRQRKIHVNRTNVYLMKRYQQWISEGRHIGITTTVRTFFPSSFLIAKALAIRTYSWMMIRIPWMAEAYRFVKRGTQSVLGTYKARA